MKIRGKDYIFNTLELREDVIEPNVYLVYRKAVSDEEGNEHEENEEIKNNEWKKRPLKVNTELGSCSCLKPISHGYPCSHLLKVLR